LKERVTTMLARADVGPGAPPPVEFHLGGEAPMIESHPEPASATDDMNFGMGALEAVTLATSRSDAVDPNDPNTWHNSPRNAPCPCGSGKKFKHCHGRTM
jgi:preprotein translocase subunit SecA